MTSYLITFFTHYDAMQCVRKLAAKKIEATLSPVPRRLSSSCGTCARFSCDADPLTLPLGEFEQLVREESGCYHCIVDHR